MRFHFLHSPLSVKLLTSLHICVLLPQPFPTQERLGSLYEDYRNRHDLHEHGGAYETLSALTMTFFLVTLFKDVIRVISLESASTYCLIYVTSGQECDV